MSRLLSCHCTCKKRDKDREEQVRTPLNDLNSLFSCEGMAMMGMGLLCRLTGIQFDGTRAFER